MLRSGTLRMRIIRGLNLPATSPLSKASAFFSSLTGAVSPLNPGKLYAAVKVRIIMCILQLSVRRDAQSLHLIA